MENFLPLSRLTTRSTSRAVLLGALALAMLATATFSTSTVEAQTIPFKAWGSGRTSGDVIKAFKGASEVGAVTVGSTGQWEINIFLGGGANVANGDTITFTVNGTAAKETVAFASGQFAPVPGLVFTLSGTGPTGPTGPTTPPVTPAVGTPGVLATMPNFDSTGKALAVFNTGTVDQLTSEGVKVKATGIWVQAADGTFQVFVIGGPAFLNDQFRAKFPNAFGVTSVLLVK